MSLLPLSVIKGDLKPVISITYKVKLFNIIEVDDVDEGTGKGIHHVQGQGHQVPVKEPIIAATDAVAEPRTVVVKVLDAIVANRAVRTSAE